jgi:hypothetical protein
MPHARSPLIYGGTLGLGVILLFYLYLMYGVAHVEVGNSNFQESAVSDCIERYRSLVSVPTVDVPNLYHLNGFCFDSLGSQLKLDQEQIRRNTFLFQSTENVVLLYMVVIITFSGVLLAGVQLVASYRLAVNGHGDLAGGGELTYSPSSGAVSFKSSVVGVTILALSFAFFLVFVKEIYPLKELNATATAYAASRPGGSPVNLLPVIPAGAGGNQAAKPANLNIPVQSGSLPASAQIRPAPEMSAPEGHPLATATAQVPAIAGTPTPESAK